MCDLCDDLGWVKHNVPLGDPRFGRFEPCTCSVSNHIAHLQTISGLSERERRKRIDDVVATGGATDRLIMAACTFAQHMRGLLTFWGGVGNGKTEMLMGITNEVCEAGVMAVYVTFADLLDWIREGYGDGASENARRRYERIVQAPVLCVDEVDKVNDTGWAQEFRSKFFDYRYRAALDGTTGTVFAMNRSPLQIFEPHIVSRLSDKRFAIDDQGPIFKNDDRDMRPVMPGETVEKADETSLN